MRSDIEKMIQDVNKFADRKLYETIDIKYRVVKVALQLSMLSALVFFIGSEISLYLN